MPSEGLEHLRHWLSTPYDAHTWAHVTRALLDAHEARQGDVALAYLRDTLASGAHPLRAELPSWWEAKLFGEAPSTGLEITTGRFTQAEARVLSLYGVWETLTELTICDALVEGARSAQELLLEALGGRFEHVNACLLPRLETLTLMLDTGDEATSALNAAFEWPREAIHEAHAPRIGALVHVANHSHGLKTLAFRGSAKRRCHVDTAIWRFWDGITDTYLETERVVFEDVDIYWIESDYAPTNLRDAPHPTQLAFETCWRGSWEDYEYDEEGDYMWTMWRFSELGAEDARRLLCVCGLLDGLGQTIALREVVCVGAVTLNEEDGVYRPWVVFNEDANTRYASSME